MKKLLLVLLVLAISWFVVTQIVIPITAGIVGYFDKEQDIE